MFSVHTKTQSQPFSNSSGLKSVFVKLRLRDGLVWTVGLIVEIKLRFSNFSGVMWTGRLKNKENESEWGN